MNKALMAIGVLLVVVSGFVGYSGAAAAQHSRIQRLESENAELKGKLDNIQDLVTEAKDDLDDVEDEVQSDESCEDTDAYSDAADVEDKLNEIDSEASTGGPRDNRTPVPIALRWRAPLPSLSRHRRSFTRAVATGFKFEADEPIRMSPRAELTDGVGRYLAGGLRLASRRWASVNSA